MTVSDSITDYPKGERILFHSISKNAVLVYVIIVSFFLGGFLFPSYFIPENYFTAVHGAVCVLLVPTRRT